MVTDISANETTVVAVHIWKCSTWGEGLEEFNLKPSDVKSARNGLLVLEPIEKVRIGL